MTVIAASRRRSGGVAPGTQLQKSVNTNAGTTSHSHAPAVARTVGSSLIVFVLRQDSDNAITDPASGWGLGMNIARSGLRIKMYVRTATDDAGDTLTVTGTAADLWTSHYYEYSTAGLQANGTLAQPAAGSSIAVAMGSNQLPTGGLFFAYAGLNGDPGSAYASSFNFDPVEGLSSATSRLTTMPFHAATGPLNPGTTISWTTSRTALGSVSAFSI